MDKDCKFGCIYFEVLSAGSFNWPKKVVRPIFFFQSQFSPYLVWRFLSNDAEIAEAKDGRRGISRRVRTFGSLDVPLSVAKQYELASCRQKINRASLLVFSLSYKMVMSFCHEISGSYPRYSRRFHFLISSKKHVLTILANWAWNSIESKFTCQIPLQHYQVLYDLCHPLQCLQVRRLHVLMNRYLDSSPQSTGVVCSQHVRFWRQNGCDNHWNGLPDNHWREKPTWNRCLFVLNSR